MGFTNQQRDIIERVAGNTAVFAAPGSGKTTVLNSHILFQIVQGTVPAQGIVAVTFTKESATDVKYRLSKQLYGRKEIVESLRIGTFHAQVFRMMVHLSPDIPVVMSPVEQCVMMMRAMQQEGLKYTFGDVDLLSKAISTCKSTWPRRHISGSVRRVYHRYEAMKRKYGRWDFDDILYEFCCLIHEDASVLQTIPSIHYILVDEFQDTNPIQWAIVECMTRRLQVPLFVVGDDDQCIYTFRGASPEYLIRFTEQVPGAQQFQLTQNFRSDRTIVEHASRVIEHNANRFPKVWGVVSGNPGDCKCYLWAKEEIEAERMTQLIERRLNEVMTQTIAVLARTRRQLVRILEYLPPRLQSAVDLHTFHDAKGKEWDVVIILGAVRVNPYLRDGHKVNVEEERRLFYVAMTRARRELVINVPLRMQRVRTEPSQFVLESGLL